MAGLIVEGCTPALAWPEASLCSSRLFVLVVSVDQAQFLSRYPFPSKWEDHGETINKIMGRIIREISNEITLREVDQSQSHQEDNIRTEPIAMFPRENTSLIENPK